MSDFSMLSVKNIRKKTIDEIGNLLQSRGEHNKEMKVTTYLAA